MQPLFTILKQPVTNSVTVFSNPTKLLLIAEMRLNNIVGCRGVVQLGGPDPWYKLQFRIVLNKQHLIP